MDPRVCVVTVTYGSRLPFLKKAITAVQSHDRRITAIVVVDNGAEPPVGPMLRDEGGVRVVVRRVETNLGSAEGFALGMRTALEETECEFLWLLDDDNVPSDLALARLFDAYSLLGSDWRNVLLSLRPKNYAEFVRSAQIGTYVAGNAPNAFMSFHLRDTVGKIRKRLGIATEPTTCGSGFAFPLLRVGFAPWGGLLLHRNWFEQVGFPDPRFFVYSDDTEFTQRIRRAGGQIYLCATSEVIDLEPQWQADERQGYPLLSVYSSPFRLYYAVRNKVYLQLATSVSNRAVYNVNMITYLTVVFLFNLVKERHLVGTIDRLRLVLRAIRDARQGALGRASRF
jgi:GT2 family glycosyltransferase